MAQIGTDIEKAKSLLVTNELVAIPTETVYGLAGNALNNEAILKIFTAKNRPKFDPLIAHIPSVSHMKPLVDSIPENARRLAEAFWPGPLTILLERSDLIPDLLTSGLDTVALRVPNHPMTLELLEYLDFPLAAPSANPFGYVSPTKASHVNDQLGDRINYILDGGDSQVGIESTIVGFRSDEVIIHRLGGKKIEEIEEVVGNVQFELNESSNPVAPGMLKTHYSPGKELLIGDIAKNLLLTEGKVVGVISFSTDYNLPDQHILSPKGDLEEAARNVFSALRHMDEQSIDLILTELVPDIGLGKAINDRLRRAAAK